MLSHLFYSPDNNRNFSFALKAKTAHPAMHMILVSNPNNICTHVQVRGPNSLTAILATKRAASNEVNLRNPLHGGYKVSGYHADTPITIKAEAIP